MENGSIYFYPSSILNWKAILLDSGLKLIILDCLKFLFLEKTFKIYGFVIVLNRIHKYRNNIIHQVGVERKVGILELPVAPGV